MKLLFRVIYLAFVLAFLFYVFPASPPFPKPPPGAKQSFEPADTETPLRRSYFVDQEREEVISYYFSQFSAIKTLRLNYPPEEAKTIIRDQTRSSYLEELVHPFRESLYINGFVPKVRKDAIVIDGKNYHQKITIRYVPSSSLLRVIYVILVSTLGYLTIQLFLMLVKETWQTLKSR